MDNSGDNTLTRNKKRKRGKSVLQNARKYLKKGVCGRGRQLETDTYQYLVRILEVYREGFPSDEEKSIFVNNVFQEAEDNEILYSSNQLGSRVIQMLLPHANDEALERCIKAFLSDLRPICSDRFASHVLQTLFELLCKKSFQSDIDDDFKNRCIDYTIKVSRFLLNNLEDFASDTYGCHIIRTVFKSLVNLPSDKEKNVTVEENNVIEIPEKYVEITQEYAQRLITWPQFVNLPYSELTSGLLQVLLKALQKIDKKQLNVYIKKLLNESFSGVTEDNDDTKKNQENKLPDVFMSKPALMLIEVVLEVASPKRYTQVYANYFLNNLVNLATTRNTNFCVQKLIQHCKEKTEFEAIFDELVDHFKEILDAEHTGVILSLGQACKRLSAKQGSFVQTLMKAFNCYEPEEHQNSIVMCACRFVYYEELAQQTAVDLQKAKLNLHSTLIIQLMLEFNKPIKIVNSILSIDTVELKNLFSNSMGSHIIDSYMNSQYVGEKSRERLIRKLQGTYQDLASTKYGSRSFEAIWNVANLKNKMNIMMELSHKDAAWSNSEFGRIIASKINLPVYKRSIEGWKDSLNAVSKKKALFSDILGEDVK